MWNGTPPPGRQRSAPPHLAPLVPLVTTGRGATRRRREPSRYSVLLTVVGLHSVALALLLGWVWSASSGAPVHRLADQRAAVRHLALTDLALWSEARYTRHPSQADRFAPFQDLPGALEHFPAGSLVAPTAGR